MDPRKVSAILQWPVPTSVKALQRFLGLANYYRQFIRNFSFLALPLLALLQKDTSYCWSKDQQEAFDTLKSAFTTAPCLRAVNDLQTFILETDASDAAIGGVLLQVQDDDNLEHPVAFFSRKLNSAERNYSTLEKELLAIRQGCIEWRHHLMGARQAFIIRTDHKNLSILNTMDCRNSRQARWAFYFSQFDFSVTYIPGTKNVVADSLSRMFEVEDSVQPSSPMFINKPFVFSLVDPLSRIKHDVASEPLEDILKGKEFTIQDDLLYRYDAIVLLSDETRRWALGYFHDSPFAGHRGVDSTLSLLSRYFWWRSMSKDVQSYISTCPVCCQHKRSPGKPMGLLQPLPLAPSPWHTVSLDFIVGLPCSQKHDTILTVVDAFTKMCHFVPLKGLPTAQQLASIFLREVFRLHGLPETLISDRGVQFTSRFWTALCKSLGINKALSSAYHPQSNGLTERMNQTLKVYLRKFVNATQNDWVEYLPLAEFSVNNAPTASTTVSPFYGLTGLHPRILPTPLQSPAKLPALDNHLAGLRRVRKVMEDSMKVNQTRMTRAANKRRTAAPIYAVGDLVWLSSLHLPLMCSSRALGPRFLGPFPITRIINPVAVRLQLPSKWRVHSTFHVSLLKPCLPDPFPGRKLPVPPPVMGTDEYEIDGICDSKIIRGNLFYLISWKGYSVSDRSWEPADQVKAARLVRAFHSAHPTKPGPLGRGHTVVLRRRSRVLGTYSAALLHPRTLFKMAAPIPKHKAAGQPITGERARSEKTT